MSVRTLLVGPILVWPRVVDGVKPSSKDVPRGFPVHGGLGPFPWMRLLRRSPLGRGMAAGSSSVEGFVFLSVGACG